MSKALEPVAIVGMAGRFPGAPGVEELWSLLERGGEAVVEVPASRWSADELYDPDPAAPGKMATRWGGFLDDVDAFDAEFFGLSRAEAERMDPQQRLCLEVGWEAVEDAGLTAAALAGSRTGVFIGATHFDNAVRAFGDLERVSGYDLAGNLLYSLANRLSYFLDLRGPSLAVDAACASSLGAVHLACQSLRAGESELALAGGVNLITHPSLSVAFSKAGAMSPRGRCRSLGQGADGFVRGEGCGVVALKPLSRARADGDRIRAVLRGSALAHGGRSYGYTVPSRAGQESLLRRALAAAGVEPWRVGLIEAHATGTALGDPIEMEALAAVYGAARRGAAPCVVGSAKANLGHLEAAAGVAGLIKAALCLERGRIPALPRFEGLNPKASWDGTRLAPAAAPREWPKGRRLAAVSAFGISGAIAHAVLEEAPKPARLASKTGPLALVLSARSDAGLREAAARWKEFVAAGAGGASLADLCWTAAVRRTAHPRRLVLLFRTREELLALLARAGDDPRVLGAAEGALGAAAARFASGADVDWRRLLPRGRCVSLPSYPWRRESFRLQAPPRPARRPLLYAPRWDAAAAPAGGAAAGRWLIFSDARGLGEALERELTARGASCATVTRGDSYAHLRPGRFRADSRQPDDFARLLADAADGRPWRGVAYLWAVDDDGPAALHGALHLAQALAKSRGLVDARLWLVTRGAQPVGGEVLGASAGLWGFGRVARRECPELRCSLADLGGVEDAASLAAELSADGPAVEVALRGPRRFTPSLARLEPAGEDGPRLRGDAFYLVTGGFGALGLATARWLAARGARRLVLLGRRGPSAEAERALAALRASGAEVAAVKADVASAPALAQALAPFAAKLAGVVHAAGVLDDGVLLQLDRRRLDAVAAPKAAGAWNLHRWLGERPVDFFVLYSSVAGVVGRAGQANYAAASAALDGLAHHRRALGLPALSVDWSGWAGEGMAARSGGPGPLLEPAAALEALGRLLSGAAPAQAVVSAYPLEERRRAGPTGGDLEERLAELLAQALRVPAGEVPLDKPLADVGLDSILAVEIAGRVERELGVPASVASLLGGGSVRDVARELANRRKEERK